MFVVIRVRSKEQALSGLHPSASEGCVRGSSSQGVPPAYLRVKGVKAVTEYVCTYLQPRLS